MYYTVTEARYVRDFTIWAKFADGSEGEIDLADALWGPVFEHVRVHLLSRKRMRTPSRRSWSPCERFGSSLKASKHLFEEDRRLFQGKCDLFEGDSRPLAKGVGTSSKKIAILWRGIGTASKRIRTSCRSIASQRAASGREPATRRVAALKRRSDPNGA
jgi:hypothetical protein